MDPRHPELAIGRIDELMKQFKDVIYKLSHETVSNRLAATEREGALVVQEICLVAPRLHEAMMQVSRNRRHDLARGVVVDMSKYKIPEGALEEEVEEPEVIGGNSTIIAVDEYITEEAEVAEKEIKPKAKKKTAKKKKAE